MAQTPNWGIILDSCLSPLLRPPGGWTETSPLFSFPRYHPVPGLSHVQLLELRPPGWSSCFSAPQSIFHTAARSFYSKRNPKRISLSPVPRPQRIPVTFKTKRESLPDQPLTYLWTSPPTAPSLTTPTDTRPSVPQIHKVTPTPGPLHLLFPLPGVPFPGSLTDPFYRKTQSPPLLLYFLYVRTRHPKKFLSLLAPHQTINFIKSGALGALFTTASQGLTHIRHSVNTC